MARRIKEEPARHRERILNAAGCLFSVKGIEAVTMDEVAKEAGYSKATLYVYFKNKEAIAASLAKQSMEMLLVRMREALAGEDGIEQKYGAICMELVRYQSEYPFYFEMALGEINVDITKPDVLEDDKKSYDLGEQINEVIGNFLCQGVECGVLRQNLEILPTIFFFWGSLSGVILLAAKKERYIQKSLNLTKQEFLKYSFQQLFQSIRTEVE